MPRGYKSAADHPLTSSRLAPGCATICCVDSVRFGRVPTPESPEIRIAVNGVDLADLVREIELPFAAAEGHPSIAGSYMGLRPEQLRSSPELHFKGSSDSHLYCGPHEKTVLLGCNCGEPGCWPLMARVEAHEDIVVWRDFEQPYRRNRWDHTGLEFRFDRREYAAALAELSSAE